MMRFPNALRGPAAWLAGLFLFHACSAPAPVPDSPPPARPAAGVALAEGVDPWLAHLVASPHRAAESSARDVHRHPAETLSFFGLDPHDAVIEIWPGGGWYTELLAPFLRDWGQYHAALPPVSGLPANSFFVVQRRQFLSRLNERADLYGQVRVVESGPDIPAIVDEASVDKVLTFRNVHNWAKGGYAQAQFDAFYAALKPGGVLGVVEHRAPPGTDLQTMIDSGYMTEDYVISLAESAGFELLEKSEINANPRDDARHPQGVWTLPPTLRLGEQDRDRYLAIGESDRMTLKFVKPRWR